MVRERWLSSPHRKIILRKIFLILNCAIFHATGNYVIQQVLTCGGEDHQSAILKTLTKNESVLRFSKHKYASNVIEAVLVHGKAHHKKEILDEVLKVSGVNL